MATTWWILELMACDTSITRHNGQALARSSVTDDDVAPPMQSGIDMSAESLGLTTLQIY
jgi:hypothetical protein